ncbi:MAG: sensor histidine kinase [Pseudomonadota bacterium]
MLELRPHGSDRYTVRGPSVALSPAEALTLGLVFHELATNAAKYGALSSQEGCVRVSWSLHDDGSRPRLELSWTEEGGPTVTPPQRQGFGSRLIERSLKGDIDGQADLDFAPQGLRCRLSVRLRVQDAAEAAA